MKRKLPNDAKRDELGYMKENLRGRENKEKKSDSYEEGCET